jgi:hypothetical protein
MKINKLCWILLFVMLFAITRIHAQEWQWSVTVDSVISPETNANPIAFLWVPANCKQVRGVVVSQHNMLEEGILQHPDFRSALASIGFAEVWVTPGFDPVFDFNKGAGNVFNRMMKKLAKVSGYSELEFAPIVPMGHSALASYPWNFAAWNPERTLAILSVHGDAPLTHLTGSGRPNPDWGKRNIDGVPGLMVMGEYEWWKNRLVPALKYRQEHPSAPISFLADAGHGHFDFSDALVNYLALLIKKAAAARLPLHMPTNKPPRLKPVIPQNGWLAEQWKHDTISPYPAAPYKKYLGDTTQAFWYFDKEMADATEAYYAKAHGKREQYIGYMEDDKLLPYNPKTLARIVGKFMPMADGVTFHLKAVYTDSTREKESESHSTIKISVTRICGPVVKINDTTFSVRFYRMGFNSPKRTGDIWLIASSPGDATYKSTVQQFNIRIPQTNKYGEPQTIDFPPLKNISVKTKILVLHAKADKGLPVYYYVKEGPAEIKGKELIITKIPPRSKFPVKVNVVAWQYGRSIEPKIQSAEPVERTFYIHK